MKVVVLGAAGMLGSALCKHMAQRHDVIGIARQNGPYVSHHCDLLDPDLNPLLDKIGADVCVNAAALTNLQTCHRQVDKAYKLHISLSALLAQRNERQIYISTDSVFDGFSPPSNGYSETCAPSPLNVYALTKLMGEAPVLNNDGVVLRTNIYGFNLTRPGNSLFEWIADTLAKGKPLIGYQDMIFNPVSIFQLSDAIEIVMMKDLRGRINIGCEEQLSKADFLLKTIAHLRPGYVDVSIVDAPEGEIIRPKSTVLDTRYAKTLGLPTMDIDEGIAHVATLLKGVS